MMKSFFKKLAFVMALAMVVTLAAPAAQASAAEEQKFTYAYQDGGKVTKLYMNAEETVDLKFVGVKNYADKKSDLEMNWDSYPKSVATVDQSGVVTAVADGKAVVYLEITDKTGEVVYTSDPVEVVVGEELAPVKLGTSKEDLADLNTVYELAVGEAVDLAFFGVPNYNKTNYTVTWVAYENVEAEKLVEAAAVTVDKNGVVVAVAEGEADVMAVIVNNMNGEALAAEWVNFLVVPAVTATPEPTATVAPEPTATPTPEATATPIPVSYEVKQISDTKAKLVFNQDVAYAKGEVTLEIVYDGGFTASWPIKDFECKGNEITFAPYVPFQDGDKFIIKAGAEDEGTEFTAQIGKVDQVKVTYLTEGLGDMGKNKAYTNGEDGVELTVKLSAKLYSNGIDVTNVYSTDDVVYSLLAENENVMIDEYEGTLVFSKAGETVTVVAEYVYYDENDVEQKTPAFVELTSEKAPTYTVTGVKAWTIATGDTIDWSKPVHEVPAYSNGTIVAIITDNYGGLTCTSDAYTNKNMDGVKKFSESRFAAEGYYVTYSSANVEKLLVGEFGDLTSYTKTSVPAIFALRNSNSEAAEYFVRNMYAGTVNVKDAKKFDKITVSASTLNLVTDGEFTTGDVTVKLFDQYGGAWEDDVTVDVSCNVEGTTGAKTGSYTFGKEKKFEFDGTEIDCSKNSFTLTFKAGNKTATLKVNLKDPKYYAADEDGLVDDIKVTSYELDATSVNQTIAKEADGTSVAAKINYYTLSNGLKVGTRTSTDAALVTSADELKLTTSTTTKGQQYVVVYDPDGNVVGAEDKNGLGLAGEDGKFTLTVANAVNDQMQYKKTGTYTVKVLQVSSFNKKDEAQLSTKYSKTFTVKNENKAVAFMDQKKLETAEVNIDAIVVDTIKFSLGGSEWKDINKDMIANVVVVENEESSYIIINEVTINVPLNGSTDSTYYTVKVAVNKAVKVPDGYVWGK